MSGTRAALYRVAGGRRCGSALAGRRGRRASRRRDHTPCLARCSAEFELEPFAAFAGDRITHRGSSRSSAGSARRSRPSRLSRSSPRSRPGRFAPCGVRSPQPADRALRGARRACDAFPARERRRAGEATSSGSAARPQGAVRRRAGAVGPGSRRARELPDEEVHSRLRQFRARRMDRRLVPRTPPRASEGVAGETRPAQGSLGSMVARDVESIVVARFAPFQN